MRIIGGTARGRRLLAPAKGSSGARGRLIRPTADRAREALFSIIGGEIEKAAVLDLYAGTGALGLEALSRGAELAVFIDKSGEAVRLINRNIRLCGFADRALVCRRDLPKALASLAGELPVPRFTLVFADPPYRQGLAAVTLQELTRAAFLAPRALVVVEEEAKAEPPDTLPGLVLIDRRRYGDTGFWFYRSG